MSKRDVRKAIENYNVIMQQAVTRLENQEQDLFHIAELVAEALQTDGTHHKQWFLAQIGLLCGLKIDFEEVGAIAP